MSDSPQQLPDIATIFATDPLRLTRTDIERVIERFRAAQANFKAGAMTAGSTKAPSPKKQEALSLAKTLDLGDLDL